MLPYDLPFQAKSCAWVVMYMLNISMVEYKNGYRF